MGFFLPLRIMVWTLQSKGEWTYFSQGWFWGPQNSELLRGQDSEGNIQKVEEVKQSIRKPLVWWLWRSDFRYFKLLGDHPSQLVRIQVLGWSSKLPRLVTKPIPDRSPELPGLSRPAVVAQHFEKVAKMKVSGGRKTCFFENLEWCSIHLGWLVDIGY